MRLRRFILHLCFSLGACISTLSAQGMIFDKEAYESGVFFETERSARIPKAHSLQDFTPYVLTQKRSTCVAYAAALAITMSEAIASNSRDKDQISMMLASPHYIYHQNRDAKDRNCLAGINIESTMKYIEERGVPNVRSIEYPHYHPFTEKWVCEKIPMKKTKSSNSRYKPDQILRVKSVLEIKAALAQNLPIIAAIKAVPSFEGAQDISSWHPTEAELCTPGFGHAVTIISFDDQKHSGAFEIQNSWGENWGNEGRIWIRYADFQQIFYGAYAIQKFSGRSDKTTSPAATSGPTTKTSLEQKSTNSEKASDKWKTLVKKTKI